MDVKHLLLDEVDYELKLRSQVFDPSLNVQNKRKLLQPLIRAEQCLNISQVHHDISQFDVSSELAIIKSKIESLQAEVVGADNRKIIRFKTRALHVSYRLNRLEPVDKKDVKLCNELKSLLPGLMTLVDPVNVDTSSSDSESEPISHSTRRTSVVTSDINLLAQALNNSILQLDENRQSSLPLRKWGINFSTKLSPTEVLDTINRIEELKSVHNVSDSKLFNGALDLFSNDSLIYYRSIKDTVTNWPELKKKLISDFIPPNYDFNLWDEVRARRQSNTESPIIFIAVMNQLFSRFANPPTIADQLSLTIANLQPFYSTALSLVPINSMEELRSSLLKLENTKLNNDRVTPKLDVVNLASPTPSTSGTKRGKRLICWNCKQEDHDFRKCPAPVGKFCFSCGEPNVTYSQCPRHKNSKNGSTGKESKVVSFRD